jgi:hypothetical protein
MACPQRFIEPVNWTRSSVPIQESDLSEDLPDRRRQGIGMRVGVGSMPQLTSDGAVVNAKPKRHILRS